MAGSASTLAHPSNSVTSVCDQPNRTALDRQDAVHHTLLHHSQDAACSIRLQSMEAAFATATSQMATDDSSLPILKSNDLKM